MISTSIFLITCFILLLAIAGLYFYFRSQSKIQSEKLKTTFEQKYLLQKEKEETQDHLTNIREEKENLLTRLASLDTEYNNLKERFRELTEDEDRRIRQFENLANRILDEKSKKFDRHHKEGLKLLLDPLKEKIKHFEEKVDLRNKESIERNSALREQIRSLRELNEKITVEAHNLTKALKGDSKTQGNWGELILESILEKSGLEKGREYHIQQSMSQENGKTLRPDVIIDLPNNKKMIIDSKVSLTAYEQFVNATEDENEIHLKAHAKSVRQHIDGLSLKRYQDIYEIESPDFVLMFVPLDTAFSSALSYQPRLYDYAFERNIVIVTPATLLATLKTVDSMWQNEKQKRYALEIAKEAGKMYDKFSAFLKDMEQLGQRIDQAKASYDNSMNKLTKGRGDLITRAQKIKQLGAKTSKQLPADLVDRALESEE